MRNGFSILHRFNQNGIGGGILLHVRESTPQKFLSIEENLFESFFERIFATRKKCLISCSYNLKSDSIASLYTSSKYDNLIFLGHFNAGGVEYARVKCSCSSYK